MSLNWENQPDGTQIATGDGTFYLLRVLPSTRPDRPMHEIQVECRMNGDKYPRVILRGEVVPQLLVEAASIEEEGVMSGIRSPTGGWYTPTASRTRTTMT